MEGAHGLPLHVLHRGSDAEVHILAVRTKGAHGLAQARRTSARTPAGVPQRLRRAR